MFVKAETIIYHVNTDGAGSGTKSFAVKDCPFCDLAELYRMCGDPSKEVIISLHPTNSDRAMNTENFYLTGEAVSGSDPAEDEKTFVFACYSRSASAIVNRKMVMHFVDMDKDSAKLDVSYYTS